MSDKPSERSLWVEGENADLKQQKGMATWCVGQGKACRDAQGLLQKAQDGWDQHIFLNAKKPGGELCSLVHLERLEGKGWKLDNRNAFDVR